MEFTKDLNTEVPVYLIGDMKRLLIDVVGQVTAQSDPFKRAVTLEKYSLWSADVIADGVRCRVPLRNCCFTPREELVGTEVWADSRYMYEVN